MGKQCRFLDEDDCYFGFAYTVRPDGQLEISTKRNKGWFPNWMSRIPELISTNPLKEIQFFMWTWKIYGRPSGLTVSSLRTMNRVVRVRALAGIIVLCSWARHSTLTVPLSTQEQAGKMPVVRKPINANPGLKVNRGYNFSCTKVFFIAKVL